MARANGRAAVIRIVSAYSYLKVLIPKELKKVYQFVRNGVSWPETEANPTIFSGIWREVAWRLT
jgi:hypothetical protein